MIEHIGRHVGTLTLTDVGRIAHYHVPDIGFGCEIKCILLAECHINIKAASVVGCYGKRLGRNVPRLYVCLRQTLLDAEGNASAARTNVEHTQLTGVLG